MCRLALINKAGFLDVEKRGGLSGLCRFLEWRLGGHGNGYALIKGGKIAALEKGVNLPPDAPAKAIHDVAGEFDWLIFHTRLASVGSICDENCHPFQRGGDIICANGTEREFTNYLRAEHLNMTDTEFTLRYFLRPEAFVADAQLLTAAYVGLHDGKVFAVRNRSELRRLNNTSKDSVVIASEFPFGFGSSRRIERFIER